MDDVSTNDGARLCPYARTGSEKAFPTVVNRPRELVHPASQKPDFPGVRMPSLTSLAEKEESEKEL
jgi:hypothetical protein